LSLLKLNMMCFTKKLFTLCNVCAICTSQCLLTCSKCYYLGEILARFRQKLFTHQQKHSKYNNKKTKKTLI
jgi:hypothetical protein